jgi:hypothetical protein
MMIGEITVSEMSLQSLIDKLGEKLATAGFSKEKLKKIRSARNQAAQLLLFKKGDFCSISIGQLNFIQRMSEAEPNPVTGHYFGARRSRFSR